jgi:endonuclease G
MRVWPRSLGPLVLLALALVATPAAAQEIHAPQCLLGCPQGGQASDDVIFRDLYVLRSNDRTKLADWVAYRVDAVGMSGDEDGRNWKADPWLAPGETLEPEDYTGANAALHTDRGHQAPLATIDGFETWRTSNYLSNITPQASALNQGPWQRLEAAERAFVSLGRGPVLYVVTGPYYQGGGDQLPGADEPHAVPAGYWKVVADLRGDRLRVASFVFAQDTPSDADYCGGLTFLDAVEALSGYRFFHGRDARPEVGLVEDDPLFLSSIGCPGASPRPLSVALSQ